MDPKDIARFRSKVDTSGPVPARFPELGPCHVWLGSKDRNGYGTMWIGGRGGKLLKAYRMAWEITNGSIPEGDGYHGTCVLHRCDNPPCCNPEHMMLGTHAQNMADMRAKGRSSRKPRHVKLAPDQRLEARVLYSQGLTQEQIGCAMGVHQTTIGRLLRGITWQSSLTPADSSPNVTEATQS